MEPPEVRRFLRQELLKKVGHSWWNRPRVYRHDRDDEREPTPSLRSVMVVPSGQKQPEESLDQQELGPAVSGDRMTLVRPVAFPATSLPHTPGRYIVIAGSTEESSSAERAITQEMVAEACDTLVRERHPASPSVWPESSRSPTESQPAVLAEPPLPQRKLASTPRPQKNGSPRGTELKPESALFSPSPVVGQEQPPPVRTHVPETESSENDASDEPGPKEDPPHIGAGPA